MRLKPKTDTFFALAAVATLLLNAPGVLHVLSASRTQTDPASAIRELVADAVPPGTPVFFVSSGDDREASVERAMRQAVTWETMPAPVPCGAVADIGLEQAVLTPCFDEAANAALAASGRFCEGDSRAGRRLWTKTEGRRRNVEGRSVTAWREVRGLAPLALVALAGGVVGGAAGGFIAATLLSLLLFLPLLLGVAVSPVLVWLATALVLAASATPSRRPAGDGGRGPFWAGMLVFVLGARLALAHAFTLPYGLSVTGGKAKLWHLAGALPPDFFTGAGWKLLEPAYPPGCAALTLGCYGAADYCGDWLTQLIPCLFAAVAAGLMVSRAEGAGRRLWLLAPFLSPLALMTCGQFYPEPILALGVLAGWDRVRAGRASGWLLLGAAGWFKNEGLVFLLAAWLAWRLTDGASRARFRHLAAALVLPMAWHVGCRLAGASLNDYAAPWQLSVPRGIHALGEALRLAFLEPWQYAFAYPVALVVALVAAVFACRRAGWGTETLRPLPAALLFSFFSILAFSFVFSCSTANAAWHLSTSLPRLLWTPALLLAWEAARRPVSATDCAENC